jgi:hypothetical protein
VLAPSDEYVRWGTNWGAAPSSCSLRSTMGPLAKLYGFEDKTTWSPSCWNLECPVPGQRAGSVADPWRPTREAFQPYNASLPTYSSTGRCLASCGAACRGPGDTTKCATDCADGCLNPMGLGAGSPFHDYRSCASMCAERCSGDSNYSTCAARCGDRCAASNPRNVSFAIAGYGGDRDVCSDTCAQRCSNSSDVNTCFIPCSAQCGGK